MPTTLANVVAKSATGHPLPSLAPGKANVGDTERLLSVAGGVFLAGIGLNTKGTISNVLPVVGAALVYRGLSGWCAAYSALGMSTSCSRKPSATAVKADHGAKVEEVTTIHKPAAELFAFWRQFSNLPRFMTHLQDVTVQDRTKSHWKASGPLGLTVEWDAEVAHETPNELIAWRSLPGADVDTAGVVRFTPAPNGRGTEVKVTHKYDPPAGAVGRAVAALFGESPSHQVRADLRRFKQLMETGEVPTTDGQPSGRG